MNHYPFLVLTLYCSSLSIALLNAETQNFVQPSAWIHTYICDSNGTLTISNQDLQALLNLLYISFDRSRITLEAQADGVHALRASWHAFANIIQLRRNPAKNATYTQDKKSYIDDTNLLYDLQMEHRRIGKTYATAVGTIVHGTLITNQQLKKGITALRDDSRRSVAQALTNVREYLDSILHMRNDQDESKVLARHKSIASLLDKNFSIGDYLWALVPDMALNSFVKADDLTIKISEEWWNALYQLLTISNIIWKPIERSRSSLYLAYYKAVYREAQENAIDMQSMTLMFNEQGLIDQNARFTQLPDPNTLQMPD